MNRPPSLGLAELKAPARVLVMALSLMALASPASATFHLWQISEVFSNADGTIQFVELQTADGGQEFVSGQLLTSTSGQTQNVFAFPSNLPGDSAGKSFLIGTTGFAALRTVVPDYIVPDGFLFPTNGSVNFAGVDSVAWTSLPTNGTSSIDRTVTVQVNSPKNFAGATTSLTLGSQGNSNLGALETPAGGLVESGIGVISGWHCSAQDVSITIDDTVLLGLAGSGTLRYDTAPVCGISTTGFSLLYNWNNLDPGSHVVKMFADGELFATKIVSTIQSAGARFARGLAKTSVLSDFPTPGSSTTIQWREETQSFVIISR